MYDYVLTFADEPTAKADPVVGKYAVGGNWRGDCVIHGVQVWNPANDVVTQQMMQGQTVNVVTHTFLPGFWLVIALKSRDPALDSHSALVMVSDRDLANSGVPPEQFILSANEPISQLKLMHIQPVFCGSNYPFS